MNWGDNLTLVGAIRQDGWVLLNTKWRAMNKRAFVAWVRDRLAPRLRRGDIEPAWSLVKKRIRDYAPRTGAELRRVARATRHVVTPYHCRQYFAHAGYGHSTGNRD